MTKKGLGQVVVVAVVAVILWSTALALIASSRFGGDPWGFLFLGSRFYHKEVFVDVPRYGVDGYDGQFYAALATDPLVLTEETRQSLDTPGYRASHLFLPLAAWLAGFTNQALSIHAYQLLAWLGALAALLVAAVWLREEGATWWAFLLLPCAGLATSVLRTTPDGAALALSLLALWLHRKRRLGLALLAVVLASLTRETSVLAAFAIASLEHREGQRRWATRFAAIPLGALATLYLWANLTVAPARPLLGAAGFPFGWVLPKLNQMLAGAVGFASVELWGFLALLATLFSLAVFHKREAALGAVEVTYVAYLALSLLLSFAVYADVYGYSRALLPLPFLALLIAVREQEPWRRWALLLVPAGWAFVGLLMVRAEIKAALAFIPA